MAARPISTEVCEEKCMLVEAAAMGDLSTVKKLITEGVPIDIREPTYGRTALMAASKNKKIEVAMYLIEQKADVNLVDKAGNTALIFAVVDDGMSEAVKKMIDKGANVNAQNQRQQFALNRAAYTRATKNIEILLDANANVNLVYCDDNAPGDTCYTALLTGAEATDTSTGEEMRPVLLRMMDMGADVNAVTRAHRTLAFMLYNHIDLVVLKAALDRGLDINHEAIDKSTAFDVLPYGYEYDGKDHDLAQAYKMFLDYGLNKNHVDGDGNTYLMNCLGLGNFSEVQWAILNSGVDLFYENNDGDRAENLLLSLDTPDGYIDPFIDFFKSAGVKFDHLGSFGTTTLHDAIIFSLDNSAVNLILKGADKNILDSERRNAAQTAKAAGNYLLAEKILSLGTEHLQQFPASGKQMIDAVKSNNRKRVQEIIKDLPQTIDEQDADGSTGLMWAASLGLLDITQDLLKAGASTSLADKFGRNALIWAATTGRTSIIKLLIPKSDLNYKSDGERNHETATGKTALIYAVQSGELTAVEALMNAGADAKIFDSENQSALTYTKFLGKQYLSRMKFKVAILDTLLRMMDKINHEDLFLIELVMSMSATPELIKTLAAKGIDLNNKDFYGCTALIWAAVSGDFESVKLLLSLGADKTILSKNGHNAAFYARREGHIEMAEYIEAY